MVLPEYSYHMEQQSGAVPACQTSSLHQLSLYLTDLLDHLYHRQEMFNTFSNVNSYLTYPFGWQVYPLWNVLFLEGHKWFLSWRSDCLMRNFNDNMIQITNLNAELNEAMNIESHLHEIHEEGNMVMSWQIVRHARTTAR